jgi:cytoskeletal protein RodZ
MTSVNEEQEQEIEAPPSPVTIGRYLRERREKKNLSLKLISQHTRISLAILEALEDDKLESLPNKTYVKGYIKNYVKLVDADQDEALEVLAQTYNQIGPEASKSAPSVVSAKTAPTPKEEESSNSFAIKAALSMMAVVFIGAVVFIIAGPGEQESTPANQQVTVDKKDEPIQTKHLTENTPLNTAVEQQDSPETAPVDEQAQKQDNQPSEQIAAAPQKETEKKTVEAKPAEKKPEPKKEKAPEKVKEVEPVVAKKKQEPKKEEAPKKKEEELDKVELKEIPLPLYSVDKSFKKTESVLPAKYRESVIGGKQNVFIHALESDTWITYKSDQAPIKKFILRKGRMLLIRGNLVRIFLGNIHGTKIFLNNEPLKISSRSGVKSLVFPQEQAKNFKLPLFIYPKRGGVIPSVEL